MSESELIEKRKKALEKLRRNWGKSAQESQSLSRKIPEGMSLFVREEDDDNLPDIDAEEIVDLVEEEIDNSLLLLDDLPKVSRAKQKVKEKQEKIKHSAQRLKETREKIRKAREKQEQSEEESDDSSLNNYRQSDIVNRQQIREDLLTVDFWQQASQWLSGINTDIHLSSTPPEEVELLYKQAKHRYKALKLLLEDTQKELDAFEIYFRNLGSLSTQKKEDSI